jgi:Tropomyosin
MNLNGKFLLSYTLTKQNWGKLEEKKKQEKINKEEFYVVFRIRKALENRTNMEDDRVAILEAQLAQAKLIAEEADRKYEEVVKTCCHSCNLVILFEIGYENEKIEKKEGEMQSTINFIVIFF